MWLIFITRVIMTVPYVSVFQREERENFRVTSIHWERTKPQKKPSMRNGKTQDLLSLLKRFLEKKIILGLGK